MAILDRTIISNKINDFINANRNGNIDGIKLNTILKDIADSFANKIDEQAGLESNVGTFAEFETAVNTNLIAIN